MADATLNDVINTMKIEGLVTRTSGTNSLKSAITEIKGVRSDFKSFFESFAENNRRQAQAAALANKPAAGGGGGASLGGGGKIKPDSKDKKSLGMLGGLMSLVGGLGAGIGVGLKGFAMGLSAIGKTAPTFLLGAGALALAIPAIGAGIAGATWILGKALPTFAEGLKSFEELDGKKIQDAGLGIGALGTGLAVFGVGGAAAGIGGVLGAVGDGITSFLGGKTPFEKVIEFQKYKFNTALIKSNAEAMISFSSAMAAAGGGAAISGLGGAVGAVGDAITGLLGGEKGLPYDEITKFEKAGPYNTEKIKANADAFVAYSTAMAKAKGIGAGAALLGTVGAIGNAVTGLLGGSTELPYAQITKFENAGPYNSEKIKANADAFVAYSTALAKAKGIGAKASFLGAVGSVFGAVTTSLGGSTELPYAQIKKFEEAEFNEPKIVKNASALVSYSTAMAKTEGIGAKASFLGAVGSVFGAVTTSLGGEKGLPYAEITKFQEAKFDEPTIVKNASAVLAFSTAMSKYAGSKVPGDLASAGSAILGGVVGLFGGKTAENSIPYTQMKTFGAAKFNKEGIETNSLALTAFGVAMSDYSKVAPKTGFGNVMSSLYDGVIGFFGGGKELIPYDDINKFASTPLDIEGIKRNALAVSTFGQAFSMFDGKNLASFEDANIDTAAKEIVKAVERLNKLKDGEVDKAAKFVAKLGGAFRGITGSQVGEMSVSQQGANGGGLAAVSGDSIQQQINGGTHYHGPVTQAPSYTSSSPAPSSEQGLPVGF
jgi:hypothetical protein